MFSNSITLEQRRLSRNNPALYILDQLLNQPGSKNNNYGWWCLNYQSSVNEFHITHIYEMHISGKRKYTYFFSME